MGWRDPHLPPAPRRPPVPHFVGGFDVDLDLFPGQRLGKKKKGEGLKEATPPHPPPNPARAHRNAAIP